MDFFNDKYKGILLCLIISTPCWLLGKMFPLIGGPVFAIIAGMLVTQFIKDKTNLQGGINYVSKKILEILKSDEYTSGQKGPGADAAL